MERFSHPEVRLLVSLGDGDGNKRMVEVAHEALFRSWGQLTGWIEQNKDDLRLRSQLERVSLDWQEHRKFAHRWSDERAVEVALMLQRLEESLTEAQREFLGPVTPDELKVAIKTEEPSHEDRASVGIRLALLGDDRPGVGVKTVETRNSHQSTPQTDLVLLPDIVWCKVPDGLVELENEDGSFEVKDGWIAKYPVTQAQYRLFTEAKDGYQNEEWWQGLPERYKDYREPGRQIPCYDNHPAVNVAWIEAMAYCRWLSRKLGKGNEVRLPVEWEWQQAASNGDAKNVYPWGAEWDGRRCNSYESQLNRTIAVGLYAQGWPEDRPLDMAGNVWELCLNEYAKPAALKEIVWTDYAERTVRGGSWVNQASTARCAVRDKVLPDFRDIVLGFRLVLGSPW